MRDCKAKRLILDLNKEWHKPERIIMRRVSGLLKEHHTFSVSIFTEIQADTFENIVDIEKYMAFFTPTHICLYTNKSGQDLRIPLRCLRDYKMEGDVLTLTINNIETGEDEVIPIEF